mgnify:CR=1 FL=1|jgi:hypothetical protein|tara:strand:+ start:15324 stop:16343 length:1020 start_codon:yes stop_codon:yes gene_type:complete
MSFKRFDAEDIVVSSDSITGPAWSTKNPALTNFFTSSIQKNGSSGDFYMSVYHVDPNTSASIAEVQFEIAYADNKGSGSVYYNPGVVGKTPTLTNFGQYRALVLEDENANFIFGSGANTLVANNFYALSVERARYKESLFPETFNLTLSGSGGFEKIFLTNDSKDVLVNNFLGSTRVFQVVSGSNGKATGTDGFVAGSGSYGLFLPDIGTILLNPGAISQSIHVAANRSNNSDGLNNQTLYDAIRSGGNFQLNSQETLSSDFVFARLRNGEFNYSENPSFISGSTGEVIYQNFINQPQVYITTIGMYNDANELLAVSKLSRPLLKDFTKEALVRVKLDF